MSSNNNDEAWFTFAPRRHNRPQQQSPNVIAIVAGESLSLNLPSSVAAAIAGRLFDDAILKPSSSSSPPPTGTVGTPLVVVIPEEAAAAAAHAAAVAQGSSPQDDDESYYDSSDTLVQVAGQGAQDTVPARGIITDQWWGELLWWWW